MAELWKGAPAAAALTEKLAVQAAALRQAGVVPTGGGAAGGSVL